jgi:penicillin-binding protein A
LPLQHSENHSMQFMRETNRLLAGVLVAFGLVALAAIYWAVAGSDTILHLKENPRLVDTESRIVRGEIVDRSGELLVQSVEDDSGIVSRHYLYPETDGTLGYYSLRYGVGGAEAAYNTILRGDDLPRDFDTSLTDSLLHRPQHGSDVQLTFDLRVQQQVASAMQGQSGAVVVLDVPSGQVLALVSLPTYDPNMLDESWDELIQAPGNPFFNRALQGSYQPGGTLETPLMAAALLANYPMDVMIDQATAPVVVDNVQIGCAVSMSTANLTLREAYAFACPEAFIRAAQDLGQDTVMQTIQTFHLDQPPTLPGFVAEPSTETTTEATVEPTPTPDTQPETLTQLALGQGRLTISPLEMAVMAAGIINDGNAPEPYTLLATRPPGASDWTPVTALRPTVPLATVNTAHQLQEMMRNAVANGAAQNAAHAGIDIGGHAAVAYSGEGPQVWFVGFAALGGRHDVAVAVVLEKSADTGLASRIGGDTLAAAYQALQSSAP